MIKVLLIDDHAIVRASVRVLLQKTQEIKVVGEAATGQEGMRLVRSLNPDVVILDVVLPDISGLEITQRLLRSDPNIKILALTSVTHDLSIFRLFEMGVSGYLPKSASEAELVNTIKKIYTGQRVVSPQLASRLALAKTDFEQGHAFDDLSEREKEVMLCIIQGVPVNNIAEKFDISNKTVHSFRSRIFQKIGVKTDLDLTLLAIHHGLITLPD